MVWVEKSVVLAIHDEQLAEHGGADGVRDEGALDSALARPQQLVAYGEGDPDIIDMAATLAFGIACNHAFVDGNKRVSSVVTELFLEMNGYELTASDAEVVQTWVALAGHKMTEAEMALWLRKHAALL
jgi:death-on-curing protein